MKWRPFEDKSMKGEVMKGIFSDSMVFKVVCVVLGIVLSIAATCSKF